jgi:3-hydroxyacyl-CoA dehydrogenase
MPNLTRDLLARAICCPNGLCEAQDSRDYTRGRVGICQNHTFSREVDAILTALATADLTPEQVDAALEAFGFAMGIFSVSDLSGLDIAFAMRQRRAATRDPGERYVAIPDKLCEAGRLGRKTGLGWYRYDEAGKKHVDPAVTAIIEAARAEKGITPRLFTADQIQRRLVAVMVNEGAKVLAEGIALRASDIDLAFVNGYGFPRLKGGPMWVGDQLGAAAILADVEEAARAGGAGSEPAPLLVSLAQTGGSFNQ